MKSIPRRTVLSASAAPLFLAGGWTAAAALQPKDYNPVRDTISALAAYGANDRWLMTGALAGLGVCHLVTSSGLHPVSRAGRIVLGIGGTATILVAAFPQPEQGNSIEHTIVAGIAFTALGIWLIVGARAHAPSILLRRPVTGIASAAMVGLSAWFAFNSTNTHRGLIERIAAGSQALWPLAVVVAARYAVRTSDGSNKGRTRES